MLAIRVIVKLPLTEVAKTQTICITGILLTIGTFAAFAIPFGLLSTGEDVAFSSVFLGCNCLCIGGGVWFYKLKLPQPGPIVENQEII